MGRRLAALTDGKCIERTLPPRSTSAKTFWLANAADMIGIPLGAMLVPLFAADVGFIGFNDFAFTAKLIGELQFAHCFADAMRKEPSGLEADFQSTRKLIARNPFFEEQSR